MRQVLIKKANGVMEPFDINKLRASLLRSGASADQTDFVVTKITRRIKPGDTTSKIYRDAFSLLAKMEKSVAARYSLRRSLSDLGPSGFPFEIFISKLFQALGYETKVGLHLKGKCIDHEVDLIAKSSDKFVMAEVKFHNNSDLKNDAKTIMYVHSRYEDLKRSNFDNLNHDKLEAEGWLITNTKFTETTASYANCYGLKLLGWNYSSTGQNLQSLIESSGLEPVTILTTLNPEEKRSLMNQKIVLCDDLATNPDSLYGLKLSKKRRANIMSEVGQICRK